MVSECACESVIYMNTMFSVHEFIPYFSVVSQSYKLLVQNKNITSSFSDCALNLDQMHKLVLKLIL